MRALFNERVNESLVSVVRLLLVASGLWTVLVARGALDSRLLELAGGYLLFTLAFWLISPPHPPWITFLSSAVDVAAVAGFSWLGPTEYPVWLLYLFPLLVAGSKGFPETLFTGALSILVYMVLAATTPDAFNARVLWPAALLGLLTACIAVLPSAWISPAKERLAWGEVRAMRRSFRLEQALNHATVRMATFDAATVYESGVEAVHVALQATALVDNPRPGLDQAASDHDGHRRLTLPLSADTSLVVQRDGAGFDAEEQAWLERLAKLMARNLQQIASYHMHCSEEQRLRSMWWASPLPAVLHAANGDILYANAQYEALGLNAVEPAEGSDASGPPEVRTGDPPRVFMLMQTSIAEGQLQLTVYREVTQERNALQARDDLLSLVGHELRGPLASIHGFGQMMVRNLGVVQQQVAQLDRLIGDLMSKPALETGQLSLDLQDVRLDDFARKAVEQFRAAHPDRELTLELQEVGSVRADPARLSQIVGNLLANAAKYSPPDTPIEVGVEMRDGEVVLMVRDHGAGIPAEHIPHLFERFYRVPERSIQQVKGLGLGLSIVQHLATAHGGRVWVESGGPGKGSTFYLSLPLPSPPVAAAATAA